MNSDLMRIIALILYGLAIAFLGAAAFFFWKLKIPSVIADLNGKTARRDIAAQREDREKKQKSAKKKMVQSKPYDGFGASKPAAPLSAAQPSNAAAAPVQPGYDPNVSSPTMPLVEDSEEETRPINSAAYSTYTDEEEDTRPIGHPQVSEDTLTEPVMTEGITASIIGDNAKLGSESDESTTRATPTQPVYRQPQQTASYSLEDEECETQPLGMNPAMQGNPAMRTSNHLRNGSSEGETVLLNAQPGNQMNNAPTQSLQVQRGRNTVPGFIEGEMVMMIHTDEVIPVTSY